MVHDGHSPVEPKIEEVQPVNYGKMIYEQLLMMNKLLGAINQRITSELSLITNDVELCKNHLSKIKKAGAAEVSMSDHRPSQPMRMPTE